MHRYRNHGSQRLRPNFKSYILNHEYPESASENLKRNIRNKVKDFILKDNSLYYVNMVKENEEKIVITADKKSSILKLCHIDNCCHWEEM